MPLEQLKSYELLKQFQVTNDDLKMIREFGEKDEVSVTQLIDDFYVWLEKQPWRQQFFSGGVPGRVRSLQSDHWRDFLSGQVNDGYVDRRVTIGKIHASINLPVTAYLAGMSFSQNWFSNLVYDIYGESKHGIDLQGAISRLCQLDANIVMHVYALQSVDTIRKQGDLTKQIVNEVTRVVETAATGDFDVRYQSQAQQDNLESPINELVTSLSLVASQAKDISEGNYDIQVSPRNDRDELGKAMQRMVASLKEIGSVAESVAQGDYQVRLKERSEKDRLSRAMNQMVSSLARFSEESGREKWIKSGMAELAVILRGGLNVEELADKTICFLARYLDAQVGAFYVTQSDGALALEGSYAFTRRKHLNNHILPGEGLVGQALKEQSPIVLSQVPKDYISISSGLGEQVPSSIIVQPLLYEKEVKGVVELGSFTEFSENKLALLSQVSETIAVTIKSAKDRETMQQLLEESQQTSEELQAQQDELKAANETLEDQADALKRSEEELTQQKEMLEKSNMQLQSKTQDLEAQKAEIELARLELQQKAEQLTLASKYKSEFLANMSHELRTPLNSLLILSQTLADNKGKNLTEEQVKDARVINEGGKALLTLINDILDLSKVEAGKLNLHNEETDIDKLLQRLQEQFLPVAQQKQLTFRIERQEQVPSSILVDSQRLEQILRNLLSNALKFTDKGSILLRVTPEPAVNDQEYVAFHVLDSGIGIPKAKQQAIFEAFQQADGSTSRAYGGTGLGLTISREMAQRLGGEIKLTSEPGEGSQFTLILPCRTQDEQPGQDADNRVISPAPAPSPITDTSPAIIRPDAAASTQILIVEDDPHFANHLQEMSRQRGYQSLVSHSGQEGIKLAIQHRPKAILLDLGLPDINGLEVLEQLHHHPDTRNIPVHVISAEDLDPTVLQKGAIGFLTKPVEQDSLNRLFSRFSSLSRKEIRQLLLVEDDNASCYAIRKLLSQQKIRLFTANTGAEAKAVLQKEEIDCCILDLSLPDMSGTRFLEEVSQSESLDLPPVIIYTGRDLKAPEYDMLMQYADRIVIKGEQSPERLKDEVALFLHSLNQQADEIELEDMATEGHKLNGRRVLLVDDDLRNTYALSKVLSDTGLQVVIADNGELALNKLVEEESIELVLMDIMMPVMDGYEAMRRIRSDVSKTLPIIALTAKAMPDDKRLCMEAGANDYLAKPVNVNQLITMVRIWLYQ